MRWRFTLNPDTANKLISEPIGWKDIEITFKRDKEWHGIFYEYSLPLRFYNDTQYPDRDAFTYIQGIYEEFGIEGHVILKVELACNDTDEFTEQGQWRMDFDFYKKECSDLCTIELQFQPSDLLMTFRNRYDQKVNVETLEAFGGGDLDPYTHHPFTLTLPPKAVPVTSDLSREGTAEDLNYNVSDSVSAGTGTILKTVIGYFQVGYNVINLDEVKNRVDLSSGSFASVGSIEPTWVIDVPGRYTLQLVSFQLTINANADTGDGLTNTSCGIEDKYNDLTAELWVDIDGTATLVDSDTKTGCLDSSDTITLDGSTFSSGELTYVGGEEIKIYVRVEASGTFDHDLLADHFLNWSINYNQTTRNVKLTGLEFADDSTTPAYLINETASRILEAITEDGYRFYSDHYGRSDSEPYAAPSGVDGPGSLRMLSLGLQIRSYTQTKLAMSFKDMFEGLNAIDNIGIGEEDDPFRVRGKVMRGEPVEYWYGNSVILQLDKIPHYITTVRLEELFSQYKNGYAKWEAEEYTGLDEFNTQRTYRTTLTSRDNTLQKICSFIASGYAIELTRRIKVYDPFTQEDWRFDNDTFIICIVRNESTQFAVEQGNITGYGFGTLIDPASVYNFRISPMRNALRWLRTVLNSYRDPEASTSKIIFTDGTGNVLASGLMTGDFIIENAVTAENADLDVNNCGDPWDGHPLYLPETWEIEYPLSFSEYQTIKATPTQTIQGRFLQETDYRDFYIDSINYKPNYGTAVFRLLPKRLYPIDQCSIYIIQQRGNGTATFGSSLLVDAALEDLMVFVDGQLMKYLDVDPSNNEIVTWNSATGYGRLSFPVGAGRQITVIHIPTGDGRCDNCIHRYEGTTTGSATEEVLGFGAGSLSNMFVFYNGSLQKYNDVVAGNNEITAYNSLTEKITFNAATSKGRELRVFGFANCTCIKTFSGHGDGTTSPAVTGIGDGTLANILVFYNGELMRYNDSETSNNDILSYDSAVPEVVLNVTTDSNRELRALKLVNCD